MIPDISNSTREEREQYIKETFRCRSDCDNCGICKVYRGKEPLVVFADYIEGKKDFFEIQKDYR